MTDSKQQTEEKKDKSLTLEILDKMNSLAAAGFGVVAALAWNDTIKAVFNVYFPRPKDSLWAQLTYAIILTIVIVLITVLLARWSKRVKDVVAVSEEALKGRFAKKIEK